MRVGDSQTGPQAQFPQLSIQMMIMHVWRETDIDVQPFPFSRLRAFQRMAHRNEVPQRFQLPPLIHLSQWYELGLGLHPSLHAIRLLWSGRSKFQDHRGKEEQIDVYPLSHFPISPLLLSS